MRENPHGGFMRVQILVACLLAGCAAQPQNDPGMIDNIARKTPEQIAAEQQQDIESAKQAQDWQTYVCGQPEPERSQLIKETRQKGWYIFCPKKRS